MDQLWLLTILMANSSQKEDMLVLGKISGFQNDFLLSVIIFYSLPITLHIMSSVSILLEELPLTTFSQ